MEMKLKIVGLLSRNIGKVFTINEIANALGEYYSFVHRTICKLIKEGIVLKTKAGKSCLCSLNLGNERTTALMQLSEIESRDEFYGKNKESRLILEDFANSVNSENIIAIILFGSYAKGKATKESDIDVLLVVKRKLGVDKTTKEVYAKYGKEINVVMMNPEEFKKQRDKAIIKEIVASHYVLHGAENFIKLVFDK